MTTWIPRLRRLVATVLPLLPLALLAVAPAHGAESAEAKAKDPLAQQAEDAFWWGDIDTLERLYDAGRRDAARNPYNGRHGAQSVRTGVARAFHYRDLNDAYFEELERLTGQWARERPRSVLAQLLYVRSLYGRAWHVRGTGMWSGVPPAARQAFTALLDKAEQHVADNAALMMQDTATHLYLVMIGRGNGWSFERQAGVAQDALKRDTADEEVLYEELVFSLLPKWGGHWPALKAFIDAVDLHTGERRGHELYALLWADVVGDMDVQPFRQIPGLRWAWIREGFESLASKRAAPYYANRLAYFACQAEDREVAQAAMARLGDQPDLEHWLGGGAAGRQNHEACKRWLQGR